MNVRLAAAVGSDLSCEVYRRSLYQTYEVHVQRDSSTLINAATTQIGRTVVALSSFLKMMSALVISTALLLGLFLIDWFAALSAFIIFGTAYFLLALMSRRELRRNSKRIALAARQQVKSLQEGLGAIRDVLLDSNQLYYLNMYERADRPQRKQQAINNFLGLFPRFVLEALALVVIALFGGFLVSQQGSGVAVMPLLGALALGAQRLLPALQQVYGGWANLKLLMRVWKLFLNILISLFRWKHLEAILSLSFLKTK